MKRHVPRITRLATAALVAGTALVGGQLLTAQPAGAAPADDCFLPTPAGIFNEHEGPTNYTRWLEPDGELRGIFLFVDFASEDGTATERNAIVADYGTNLPAWFSASSYGQLDLDLDFTSSWEQMPKDQNQYNWPPPDFATHQAYMQDAVNEWDAAIDFSQYDLVYVVSPVEATSIGSSPAFIASTGFGLMAENNQVELRHGANLGADRSFFGFQILAHETGHVFGLPDLYQYGLTSSVDRHRHVGGWDTMGRINGSAPDYLAYHKWKMDWLDDSQIVCTTTHGWQQQVLTPLSTSGGVKAYMVRVDANRTVVVENRQSGAIDGQPAACYQAGVLVYLVDGRAGGGGTTIGSTVVMPVTVADAKAGPLGTCTDPPIAGAPDVAPKANATLTTQWETVQIAGVTVQLTEISGANRKVAVSW
jgi:M6 family metalloprotease-like protein